MLTKMDHYWQYIQGWPNELPRLYSSMVKRFHSGSHFVEVGSWKGCSTVAMAVEIINSGKKIKFDAVDTWEGSPVHYKGGSAEDLSCINGTLYQEFIKNIEPVKDYINPIKLTSVEAAKLYRDESLDFVCIDADHEYDPVKEDILAWMPKVKRGGILAGDDFSLSWPGIIRAVKELVPEYRTSLGTWWWIKP